jgi:hypothetical protein
VVHDYFKEVMVPAEGLKRAAGWRFRALAFGVQTKAMIANRVSMVKRM